MFALDYRLEIDWDYSTLTTPTVGDSYVAALQVKRASDSLTLATVARRRKSTGSDHYYSIGSDTTASEYSTTDTTGKFAIERTDSTTTIYIWTGGQWEWDGDTSGRVVSYDNGDNWVRVRLIFLQEANGSVNSNIDNFEMVYGKYICPTSSSSSSSSSSST
jgi:hypothetical protein